MLVLGRSLFTEYVSARYAYIATYICSVHARLFSVSSRRVGKGFCLGWRVAFDSYVFKFRPIYRWDIRPTNNTWIYLYNRVQLYWMFSDLIGLLFCVIL